MQVDVTRNRGDPHPNGTTPGTILIVEDHELNMKLFSDLLEMQGYRILQARDGAEGLELTRRCRPDLILMDLRLPDVSGLDVAKWIKAETDLSGIPIIAVTAFAMRGDEEKARQAGCDAYITKPISIRNFLATVDRYVSSAPQ